MRQALRQVGYGFVALVVASVVTSLFWVVFERFEWTPHGASAWALLGFHFALFGMAGAIAYTVLNEGPRALRVLLPQRPQVRRR